MEVSLCEKSFYDFVMLAAPILEPETDWAWNWHIEHICKHLQAVREGKIRKLLINVPPGFMKSVIACVCWPAWIWTTQPNKAFLFASYDSALAIRDSVRTRDLIKSEWYQTHWGERVKLKDDQDQKKYFELTRGGFRVATSPTSTGTGHHCHHIVVDDPHNVKQAESDTKRSDTNKWWRTTIPTRVRIGEKCSFVVIMQRLHEEDLSAQCIATGDYEHVMIPMRFEQDRKYKTHITNDKGEREPFLKDGRTEESELLWKDKFPEEEVKRLEKDLGADAAGQLEQRPVAKGGQFFKREWFTRLVDAGPGRHATRVRYWDKASTSGAGDYSCGALVAIDDEAGIIYVEHVIRGQWSTADRNAIMEQTAEMDMIKYKGTVSIWIEAEPGSGGKESAEITVRQLRKHPVYIDKVNTKKEIRAKPFQGQAMAGNVQLVKGTEDNPSLWLEEFIAELETFPRGKHDDQVDAVAGAYAKAALSINPFMPKDMYSAGPGDKPLTEEEMEDMPPTLKEIMDFAMNQEPDYHKSEDDGWGD